MIIIHSGDRELRSRWAMAESSDHLQMAQERTERREGWISRERERVALTLGPVGPPRHMGVVVVRHSTQHGLPASASAAAAAVIPIT